MTGLEGQSLGAVRAPHGAHRRLFLFDQSKLQEEIQ